MDSYRAKGLRGRLFTLLPLFNYACVLNKVCVSVPVFALAPSSSFVAETLLPFHVRANDVSFCLHYYRHCCAFHFLHVCLAALARIASAAWNMPPKKASRVATAKEDLVSQ